MNKMKTNKIKNNKNLIFLSLNLCLILTLAACGKNSGADGNNTQIEGSHSQQKACSIHFSPNDTIEEISSKAFLMGQECQMSEAQVLNRLNGGR